MQLSIINKTYKIFFLLFLLNSPIFSQTYKIVDTGQITFYDNSSIISSPDSTESFYGQDAQYASNQPSYTNNLDGTITDNVTGLMWQQDMGEKITFEDAFTKADSLSLASYSDWRFPTLKELYSLILFTGNVGTGNTALKMFIDTLYFNHPIGDTSIGEREIDAQTWSATEYAGITMNKNETVFGVNFVDGHIKGYPKNTRGAPHTMYCRLVRGNTEYGKNNFVDNGDGTISDLATGLMWQQSDDGVTRDWGESLEYAENLNLADYSDWRLPNAKELQSIVDYTRSPQATNSPAIDPIFATSEINDLEGNSGHYPYFWTSSTFLRGSSYANGVYITFGEGKGVMNGILMDVHGAGCQRSDPKSGNGEDYPSYSPHAPQGDVNYVYNHVRAVRDAEIDTTNEYLGKSEGGHTLFAPLGSKATYLIDENGDVFKSWESEYAPALSAYLLNDKSLLRTSSLGRNGNTIFNGSGGAGGKVERYSWEGNKIWEFIYSSDQYLLHHDIEYLPNGNILMIAWEYKTELEAIEAGRNPSLLTDVELWPDKIIEVEPTGDSGGNIVWEWNVWDHLVQDYDISKSNYGSVENSPRKININFASSGGADWNHTNAIDYYEEHDQILITVKNFSEIWIINHNTTTEEAASGAGDLLYRWGNPQAYNRGTSSDQQLFGPHDGQWIEKEFPGGNDVLIFNNGKDRVDGSYSSIDQISLPVNTDGDYSISSDSTFKITELTWTYQSSNFFADHISGAQRLPGGNTIICEGTEGRFFEVTEDGEIVWEYINPFSFTNPQDITINEVFRAYRYNLDGITNVETKFDSEIPNNYSLSQNYPNPFNPSTQIYASVPESGIYTLRIYNVLGQEIAVLLDGKINAGIHTFNFDASNLTSGIYFYNFSGNNFSQTKKMMLMK